MSRLFLQMTTLKFREPSPRFCVTFFLQTIFLQRREFTDADESPGSSFGDIEKQFEQKFSAKTEKCCSMGVSNFGQHDDSIEQSCFDRV